MGLKTRIDEALDATDWLERSIAASTRLASLGEVPIVITRSMGQEIIADEARMQVDVLCLMGVSTDTRKLDEDYEPFIERMLQLLRFVPDCYPEEFPISIDYDNDLFNERRNQRRRADVQTYIVIRFVCVSS